MGGETLLIAALVAAAPGPAEQGATAGADPGATATSSAATAVLGPTTTTTTATSAAAIVTATSTAAPPAIGTLYGRILERGTRRPLAEAQIEILGQTAFTDDKGRFELARLPAGEHPVAISVFEHEPAQIRVHIRPKQRTEIHVYMIKLRVSPYEIRVVGKGKTKEPTVYQVDLGELSVMPGALGDGLKAVQNFPGASRTPLGLGGLIVRGSPAKDTKVFLDGHEIPLLFHFGGLNSVINSDTLEKIDFVPGNFGARYGRATGGIVELESRAGKAQPHGYMDVSLLDVTFLAEADVAGGGVLISGRRSWLDTLFALFFAGIGDDLKISPREYDYQARYEHKLLGGPFSLLVYGADDRFSYVVGNRQNHDRPTFDLHNGFHRLQLQWAKDLGDGFSTRFSAAGGFSTALLQVGDAYDSDRSDLEGQLRAELRKKMGLLTLEGGLDVQLAKTDYTRVGPPPLGADAVIAQPNPVPEITNGTGFTDGGDPTGNVLAATTHHAFSPAVWMEASMDFSWLRLVPGVRVDYLGLAKKAAVDPRFNAFVYPGKETTLKGGVGLYTSPPELELLTPVFGNPALSPERALHSSLGVEQELPFSLRAGAEVYYKQFFDLPVRTVRPTQETDPITGAPIDVVTFEDGGEGHAMGLELLLRRRAQVGLSGWIAYSLSRSERVTRSGGREQLFAYDQTHILTVVASYRTESDWTFGVRFRYASGNPYAPVQNRVFIADEGTYAPIFADEPSERLPGFLQIDLRLDKEWVFRDMIATAYIDVENVTNRSNAEGYQYNFNYTERRALNGLPILPTAGVRLQF